MAIWIFCGNPVSVWVVVKLGKSAVGVDDLFEAVRWVVLKIEEFLEHTLGVVDLLSGSVSLRVVLVVDGVSQAVPDVCEPVSCVIGVVNLVSFGQDHRGQISMAVVEVLRESPGRLVGDRLDPVSLIVDVGCGHPVWIGDTAHIAIGIVI